MLNILQQKPIRYSFGRPIEGEDVLWRLSAQTYSIVMDAEREIYGSSDPELEMRFYKVVRRTPKGAWITYAFGGFDKFVLLTANKKWACHTEDEALESFTARKRRQVSILSSRLARAEQELSMACVSAEEIERAKNV